MKFLRIFFGLLGSMSATVFGPIYDAPDRIVPPAVMW
jgi:hypothetical protein